METAIARSTDPETSHAAAASISSTQLTRTRRQVLALFRRYGDMTDTRLQELRKRK